MREEEIVQRLKYFLGDLAISLKPLESTEDKIHFVKTIIELQVKMYRKDDENFNEEDFIDEHLMAKFRSKMKAFVDRNLPHYFSEDEMYQESINERLHINPAVILDSEEFFEFTGRLNNILTIYKTNLYLTESNSEDEIDNLQGLAEQNSNEAKKSSFNIGNKEFTRNRQALAMYYLFKSIGITPRLDIPLSALARLAHLLSAMPYDNINNSPIYDSIKVLPDMKSETHKLEDLMFVKKHFHFVKHTAAIELIEKEISILEQKLKF